MKTGMFNRQKWIILMSILMLSGCASLPYKGTIHYIEIEGGFYGITSDKGESILPLNLNEKYKQEGLVVTFSGEFDNEIMTIQQWGKPFIIKEIKIISNSTN